MTTPANPQQEHEAQGRKATEQSAQGTTECIGLGESECEDKKQKKEQKRRREIPEKAGSKGSGENNMGTPPITDGPPQTFCSQTPPADECGGCGRVADYSTGQTRDDEGLRGLSSSSADLEGAQNRTTVRAPAAAQKEGHRQAQKACPAGKQGPGVGPARVGTDPKQTERTEGSSRNCLCLDHGGSAVGGGGFEKEPTDGGEKRNKEGLDGRLGGKNKGTGELVVAPRQILTRPFSPRPHLSIISGSMAREPGERGDKFSQKVDEKEERNVEPEWTQLPQGSTEAFGGEKSRDEPLAEGLTAHKRGNTSGLYSGGSEQKRDQSPLPPPLSPPSDYERCWAGHGAPMTSEDQFLWQFIQRLEERGSELQQALEGQELPQGSRKKNKNEQVNKKTDEGPTHAPPVPPMKVDLVRAWMPTDRRERFDHVFHTLCNPFSPPIEVCPMHEERSTTPPKPPKIPPLPERHAQAMVSAELAEWCDPPDEEAARCCSFPVWEEAKQRWRIITWTYQANDVAKKGGYKFLGGRQDERMPTVTENLAEAGAEYAGTFDLKSAFYQVEIPPHARKHFAFRVEGGEDRWARLCRVPMGHTCAPELLQLLVFTISSTTSSSSFFSPVSSVLTPSSQEQARLNSPTVQVYLDNIRYTGKKEHVKERAVRFLLNTELAKVTLSEKELGEEGNFLGFVFHYPTRKVRPGSRIRDKVEKCDPGKPHTRAEWEGFFGRLLYLTPLLPELLPGECGGGIFWLRHNVNMLNRGVASRAVLHPPPHNILQEIRKWKEEVLKERTVEIRKGKDTETRLVLWTDASTKGAGWVIQSKEKGVRAYGRKWKEEEKKRLSNGRRIKRECELMVRLEGMALLEGLREVQRHRRKFPGEGVTQIYVDSQGLLGAIQKGRAREWVLNEIVQEVRRTVERGDRFSYIGSEENPADLPSRVFEKE